MECSLDEKKRLFSGSGLPVLYSEPMTLYLKYRPQSFADVVGQDHIVTTLEQAVEQSQLTHAYLFSGSRGTGKTSVARILAKSILTKKVQDETLKKQILEGVEEGSLVDLIEIDAASTRGIDDIRDLIDKIQFSPVVAGAKVYIVDEVHMLTKEAFNALLKTLEEPPEYAFFILATTELHKVPETIQSRCQRFPFRRVREEDLIRRLQFIADQEHITADRAALRLIANHATGSFRDAISLLDQLRALKKITIEEVQERIGMSDETFIQEVFDAIEAHDRKKIPEIVTAIEDSGVPLDQVLRSMLTILRERMHIAIEKGESTDAYVSMMDVLLGSLKDLRLSPVPGLVMEATILHLAGDDGIPSVEAPVKRMKESTKKKEKISMPEEIKESKSDISHAAIEVDALTTAAVRKHWNSVVDTVTPPSVRMSLKNAVVTNVEKETVSLAFTSSFHKEKVAALDASRAVEQILQTIFKKPVRLNCVYEEQSLSTGDEASVSLVEAAEEVFGSK